MDIETVLIDNVHVPYLICFFDGQDSHSYWINTLDSLYLEDNISNMIESVVKDLTIRKYKNHKIYLHNFSKFDGIFLFKHLAKIGDVDPIINKDKFISLGFTNTTIEGPLKFIHFSFSKIGSVAKNY